MPSLVPCASAATLMSLGLGLSACSSPSQSVDARFAAIYTAEWKWRQEQFPDNEDAQRPVQDHLPRVDPATAVAGAAAIDSQANAARTPLRSRKRVSEVRLTGTPECRRRT